MTTTNNTLVFELPEKELSTALAAFKLAHKEEADLRFAPDRAWIEGYAAASKTKHTEAPKSPDAEETRRTDVARAIWEVMREHEDSCDLSLDDIPTSHQVWFCADAAISAQAAHVDAATWLASRSRTGSAAMSAGTTLAPADAEILAAAEDFRSQYTHGGTTFDEFDEIGFARAVLAKWGQPAQAQAQADSVQEDAARLDFLIDQGAYVVSDPDTCTGHWLHWARPDGSTRVQGDEHPTPRAAIDAARKQGENHDR